MDDVKQCNTAFHPGHVTSQHCLCMPARRYRFPVRHHLKEGANEIRVIVQSAVSEAAACAAEYPYPVPYVQVAAHISDDMIMHASHVPRPSLQPCHACPDTSHHPALQFPSQVRIRLWLGLGPCVRAGWACRGSPGEQQLRANLGYVPLGPSSAAADGGEQHAAEHVFMHAGVSVRQAHSGAGKAIALSFDVLLGPDSSDGSLEVLALDGPAAWAASAPVGSHPCSRSTTLHVRHSRLMALECNTVDCFIRINEYEDLHAGAHSTAI